MRKSWWLLMKRSSWQAADRSLFVSLTLSISIGACSFYAARLFSAAAHAQSDLPNAPVTINYTYSEYTSTGQMLFTNPPEDLKEPPPDYVERTPEGVEQMHIAQTGSPFWGSLFLRAIKRDYAKEGVLRQR